jgi:hypothetical protein
VFVEHTGLLKPVLNVSIELLECVSQWLGDVDLPERFYRRG